MKGNNINAREIPTTGDTESFWKSLRGKESNFHEEVKWIKNLEKNYCKNVRQQPYKITDEILNKDVNKLFLGKSPGRDLVKGYWYKRLSFYKKHLLKVFQETYEGVLNLPNWLKLTRTTLLPKSQDTKNAKNYRPIACLNIFYKLYTSCLNIFLQNHCEINGIITSEQAGGKTSAWGCTEQLFINKSILSEVRRKKRNLLNVWYRKTFHSVPHDWIIKARQLAKVRKNLVESIKRLTKQLATILNLRGEDQSVTSDEIHYAKGIFHGGSLSVLSFILSVNPLSFMLGQLKGYSIGDDRKSKVTHNFFVDDLKLFANTEIDIKKLLDLVTTFSREG